MWIPSQLKRIEEVLRAGVSAIQKAAQENKAALDDASSRQDQTWTGIGRQLSEMRSDDEYKRGANTYKHKSYWQQVILNWFTGIGFIGAFFALLVSLLTLREVKKSADAAKSAAQIAACTLRQNQKQFLDTLKEMQAQTTAQRDAAAATQAAANIAKDTLHVSQRADIVFGPVTMYVEQHLFKIPLINDGHMPSGGAVYEVRQSTVNIIKAVGKFSKKGWEIDGKCNVDHIDSVPVGNADILLPIEAPLSDVRRIQDGTEEVILVARIKYNDGFPDTKPRVWQKCWVVDTMENINHSCDATVYLAQLRASHPECDRPPSQETK